MEMIDLLESAVNADATIYKGIGHATRLRAEALQRAGTVTVTLFST